MVRRQDIVVCLRDARNPRRANPSRLPYLTPAFVANTMTIPSMPVTLTPFLCNYWKLRLECFFPYALVDDEQTKNKYKYIILWERNCYFSKKIADLLRNFAQFLFAIYDGFYLWCIIIFWGKAWSNLIEPPNAHDYLSIYNVHPHQIYHKAIFFQNIWRCLIT